MKNIQIQKIDNKYRVKLHYGDKDLERSFVNADNLLDFVGKFLKDDNYKVSNIKNLKIELAELETKLSIEKINE